MGRGRRRRCIRNVNVDSQHRDLGIISLENKVNLHGNSSAILQVLARGVEVELLEVECLVAAGELEGAGLANDLDGASQVLECGTGSEVGDVNLQLRSGELGEATGDIDGRLVSTLGAGAISGGVERKPVGRALILHIHVSQIMRLEKKKKGKKKEGIYEIPVM